MLAENLHTKHPRPQWALADCVQIKNTEGILPKVIIEQYEHYSRYNAEAMKGIYLSYT